MVETEETQRKLKEATNSQGDQPAPTSSDHQKRQDNTIAKRLEKGSNEKHGKNWPAWIQSICAIALVVITFFYTLYAYRQVCEMRKAVKTSQDAVQVAKDTAEKTLAQMQAQSEAMKVQADAANLGAKTAYEAFVMGKAAQLEVLALRVINIGVTFSAKTDFQVSLGGHTEKPQEQGPAPTIGPPPSADHTTLTLIFRNKSPRRTAVIRLFVREKEQILGGLGYNNQIKLPIQIEPWGVEVRDIRMEKNDQNRTVNILIQDIDDNESVVVPGPTWTKAKAKR